MNQKAAKCCTYVGAPRMPAKREAQYRMEATCVHFQCSMWYACACVFACVTLSAKVFAFWFFQMAL